MSTKKLSRRDFIRISTLVSTGAVIAACAPVTATPAPTQAPAATSAPAATAALAATALPKATAAPTAAPTQGPVTLQWWDHFMPLEPLHKKLFETYRKTNPNVEVKQTVYNPADMGKALQLAYPNKQAPDIHTLAGISLPPAALVKEGWFAPIDAYIDDAFKKQFPAGTFVESVNVFGGKVYSFPIFSFRQYTNVTWYNIKLATDAGVDPAKDLLSWEGFRTAAKKITAKGKGQVFGWIEGIGFVDRMADHMIDIAKTAGSPGPIDWKTGAYMYASDPFIQSIEWWKAMAMDGSLFPASNTLDMRNGRARWVTGVACLFFDGAWNPGAVVSVDKAFLDNMGVLPCPTPDGKPGIIGRGPAAADFWVSAQSKSPKHAAGLLKLLVSEEHQMGLADRMDQPPMLTSAVEKSPNAHPTYKAQMKYFADSVRLEPAPAIRNPLTNDVLAEMKPIHPNLGEIIQGAITADVKDVKATLKDFNDAMSKERDRAIKVVQGKGGKVSVDDWVFADWTRGQDYTTKPAA